MDWLDWLVDFVFDFTCINLMRMFLGMNSNAFVSLKELHRCHVLFVTYI